MDKIKYLPEIQSEIKKINSELPNINYGGCGTFSYHLSKALNKYDIKSEFYYLPGEPAAIQYDILFSHIVIKVDKYIIDNNGFYSMKNKWVKDLKPLSISKLEEMLSIPQLWNSKFYNSDNIEKLKEAITKI